MQNRWSVDSSSLIKMLKTVVLFTIFWLYGCVRLGETALVKSYIRRDISGEQWKYFERQAQRWNGLWERVNATGDVFQFTRMKRKFEKIPGGYNGLPAYRQTNLYENPNWSDNGETKRQWMYVKTDLQSYGLFLFPNGTVLDAPLPGIITFFPYGFGHWTFGTVDSSSAFHIVENYVLHPMKSRIRFTVAAIYVGGKFSYISFAREVANTNKFPAAIWKGGKVVDVVNETKPLMGAWTEVTSCVREPSRIYERYVRVVDHDIEAIPSGPDFVTLRMRDGPIVFSCPATFAPLNGEKDVKHYQEWKISQKVYVRVVLSFAPDGQIKRDCVTVYHAITGLD